MAIFLIFFALKELKTSFATQLQKLSDFSLPPTNIRPQHEPWGQLAMK
jgi:hypothetical protein